MKTLLDGNYILLNGYRYVDVDTCEVVFADYDGEVHSIGSLTGNPQYLTREEVDKLCAQEDKVDNYLQY